MSALTCTDRAAEPAILGAITARPGITQAQIVADLGVPDYRVRRVLTDAKRRKLVGAFRTGVDGMTWWPADMLAAAKRSAKQAVEAAQREQRRQYAAARFQRRMGELRASPELSPKPIRRHADPAAPLPFICRAPASVFHLGGML